MQQFRHPRWGLLPRRPDLGRRRVVLESRRELLPPRAVLKSHGRLSHSSRLLTPSVPSPVRQPSLERLLDVRASDSCKHIEHHHGRQRFSIDDGVELAFKHMYAKETLQTHDSITGPLGG